MGRWLAALVGLVAGSLAGCLLELDHQLACGDGFLDMDFEECDPGKPPSSLADRCEANEVPLCDPVTCQLHCGACGDGVLDPGEGCDGNNTLVLPSCQDWTCAGCQVVCPRCGNGQVDLDEECDFELALTPMPMPLDCSEISVPGRPNTMYEPGGMPTCRSDCRWDRSTCNLCGNGLLDDQIIDPTTDGPINAAERCDGELFDLVDRFNRCLAACGQDGRDCNVTCGDGCLEIQIDPNDSGCCVLPEYPRSASDPCCCELVGEAPAYCSGVFDPGDGSTDEGGEISPNCPG